MSIKTNVNNIEKEVEQIRNTNGDYIDYIYKRVGDTEVEGDNHLDFQSIGGTLKNYRIYGNTVDGESVGDFVTDGDHAGKYCVPVIVEGKNLLQNTATSQTINGVTFTVNSDDSVTCNGTATIVTFFTILMTINQGSYIVSGAPAGSNWGTPYGTIRLRVPSGGTDLPPFNNNDFGTGVTISSDKNSNNDYLYKIRVPKDYTCENLTFYPMIRKADITDDTYEPYHAPVTTPIYLPEQIRKVGDEAEYIDYGEQKQHRVRKNELKNAATSQSINGLTFMVNTDKSITVNGTATETVRLLLGGIRLIKNVPYKISGCPSGGSTNTYRLDPRYITGSVLIPFIDTGNGSVYTSENDINLNIYIYVQSGYTCDNLTFYPMIRKADIEDDTYEPYIENTDLNVTLPALLTLSGTNMLSVGTEVQPSKVYIKDAFDYKKVFIGMRKIENKTPANYKNIEDNNGTLKNYRIYGNTVDGESVGDLVTSGEHAGEYKVPVTVSNGTDTLTTHIYLPEQIRKVGDEAEYIDYAEQKQHRVRKNLLQNMAVSKQIGNVIFTVLTDGTVTCEISDGNPASQNIGFVINSNGIFEAGAYKISGCPTGGGSNYKMIAIFDADGQQVSAVDTGQGVTVELGSDAQIERNGFYIAIYIGAVFDRLVFSPMIRKVDIEDDTYDPYITNTELDVTLPALPTLTGTNVLSVRTAVQPSEVYIKGKIKEIN